MAALSSLLLCGWVAAQVPRTVGYQGYLTDATGRPANGIVPIAFSLYDTATGGTAIWTETRPAVVVTNGVLEVALGTLVPIELPFDKPYFLGVRVGSDAEMVPRQALASSPYALRAANADALSPAAVVSGGQITGSISAATISGSQITGTITQATVSGPALARLQGMFVGALQPTAVAANTISVVDSAGNVGEYSSITLGSDGMPVIAYYDGTEGDLKVAKCPNAACSGSSMLRIVDAGGTVGQYASITIGADGLPVIAYYDVSGSDVKVAKCVDGACAGSNIVSTVDSTGIAGRHASIAIGADDLPVIAYHDAAVGRLKVAKCANAACSAVTSISTVDSGGTVGQFTSIAIGVDALPVISYHDVTNANLKVAKCANAACVGTSTVTTVDAVGDVGKYSSIAIGADGLPVVSYYDATNGDLKVAKCANAGCTGTSTLSVVDTGGDVGEYSSVTIGADGLPVISYYDRTNGDLRVAKCANAGCAGTSALSTVDSTGDVGRYTSITIGADGLPVISYFDAVTGDLKVAKCANVFCAPSFRRR